MEEKLSVNKNLTEMTRRTIKRFMNEICSKGPKRNYITNITDVFYIDNTWSLDILYLKDYGPENKRGYRYVLVIIDIFLKFALTFPLKNKRAQTLKDSSENIIKSPKKNKI